MIAGNGFYVIIDLATRNIPNAYPIDDLRYLEIRHLDVVRHDICMFGKKFTVDYYALNSAFGCPINSKN